MKESIYIAKGVERQAEEWLVSKGYDVPDFRGRYLHRRA
jgi:hypothetical protein